MWPREAVRSGAADKGRPGAFHPKRDRRRGRSHEKLPGVTLYAEDPVSRSNRELLGSGISQLIENKHRRTVLMAKFEPNHFFVFRNYSSK